MRAFESIHFAATTPGPRLIVTGALTFAGLMLASRRAEPAQSRP